MRETEVKKIIEALLFASPIPLTQTKVNNVFNPDTPNLKKMWSVFRYTPLLHRKGQKTEKPNITLSYYQICFLALPMQFLCIFKN